MSFDKDCCLETYSEAFREGAKAAEEDIIKVLEELNEDGVWRLWEAIERLKGKTVIDTDSLPERFRDIGNGE